jgi:hypothetical protein
MKSSELAVNENHALDVTSARRVNGVTGDSGPHELTASFHEGSVT